MEADASSGSKMIKVSDGVHVFLGQLDYCAHGGANFECLTPIEFDSVVDIKKIQ